MSRALVFPGQGSQAVGMGRELADAFAVARQTFEEIDEALKQKLSRLMREGRIPQGKPIVLVAFGGGLTWASSVWRV